MRGEVLEGVERRRRWSAEQKLEIAVAAMEPGVSVSAVARRYAVSRQQVYVSTTLRLTLLAPDIVEAILNGRQEEDVTLEAVMAGVPVVWDRQFIHASPSS